jgi:hypothetical protein
MVMGLAVGQLCALRRSRRDRGEYDRDQAQCDALDAMHGPALT